VDLEAQEPNKTLGPLNAETCPQCSRPAFSSAADCAEPNCAEPNCAEPNCPRVAEPEVDWDDSAPYSQLARANLLRIRGDLGSAKALTQRVIRTFPKSTDAHALMGDLFVDEGRLEEARNWYEIALDLAPGTPAYQRKLEGIRQRIAEHEASETARQLGLPTSRGGAKIFALSMVLFVIMIGLGAYWLGDRGRSTGTAGDEARTLRPITFGGPSAAETRTETVDSPAPEPGSGSVDSSSSAATPPASPPPSPSPEGVSDLRLLEVFRNRCLSGGSILVVIQDPRTRAVTITLGAREGELLRSLAARVGLTALPLEPEAPRITLRVLVAGTLQLVADITPDSSKAALAAASPADPSSMTDAQLELALVEVWTPPG